MYNMEEKLYTKKELEDYGQQIQQKILEEVYTAVWRTSMRLPVEKAQLFHKIEDIANGHGLSIDEKIDERFQEEAAVFKGYLEEIIRYANIHIDILNKQYHLEDKNGK